jgi:hypothetical protein
MNDRAARTDFTDMVFLAGATALFIACRKAFALVKQFRQDTLLEEHQDAEQGEGTGEEHSKDVDKLAKLHDNLAKTFEQTHALFARFAEQDSASRGDEDDQRVPLHLWRE